MDEPEAREAYKQLRELIMRSRLAWILDHVDDEVRRGKPGVREVNRTTLEAIYIFDRSTPHKRRNPKTQEFTTTTPFTEVEQLQLLVAATQRVLREIPSLTSHGTSVLARVGANSILFVDDSMEFQHQLQIDTGTPDTSDLMSLLGKVLN